MTEKISFIKEIRRIADILSVCFAFVIRFFITYAHTIIVIKFHEILR